MNQLNNLHSFTNETQMLWKPVAWFFRAEVLRFRFSVFRATFVCDDESQVLFYHSSFESLSDL